MGSQPKVGVRALKANLSAYLRRAAAGERISVTDRGRPVATLGPLVDEPLSDAEIERRIQRLAKQGLIIPAQKRGGLGFLREWTGPQPSEKEKQRLRRDLDWSRGD